MSTEAKKRATVTMTDQCFASGSNFVVGVAVARIAGPKGLGAFSLAYGGWILVNNIHRSLITDPMAIFDDFRGPGRSERIETGFAGEIALGLMATIAFLVIGTTLLLLHQSAFGIGILAVAPWVTVLDVQDYWRWVGFIQGEPNKALVNDVVFALAQTAGFAFLWVAHVQSVFAVVAAWGVGACFGAVYGFKQFGVRPKLRGGLDLLRSRWDMSKWIAANTTTNWGASQIYLIVAGVILGPAALGGLKAAQALVTGPSAVVIHAGGSFGLPEASRALTNKGWSGLTRVSWLIAAAGALSVGLVGVAVFVAGGQLLGIFYGAQFVQYASAAKLTAVAFILAAVAAWSDTGAQSHQADTFAVYRPADHAGGVDPRRRHHGRPLRSAGSRLLRRDIGSGRTGGAAPLPKRCASQSRPVRI